MFSLLKSPKAEKRTKVSTEDDFFNEDFIPEDYYYTPPPDEIPETDSTNATDYEDMTEEHVFRHEEEEEEGGEEDYEMREYDDDDERRGRYGPVEQGEVETQETGSQVSSSSACFIFMPSTRLSVKSVRGLLSKVS
ncbi:hypothetical protein FKM82_030308 [Ascaphus truei]